jgi:hypothetical protein
MTCGLSSSELIVLKYLVRGRCVSAKHSISIKAIERDIGKKIEDLEDALTGLVEAGYVGSKKKSSVYYYANPGPSIKALAHHGVIISRGGRGPI